MGIAVMVAIWVMLNGVIVMFASCVSMMPGQSIFSNFTLSNILVIPALSRDPRCFEMDYEIPARGRDDEGGVFRKFC